LQQKIPQTVENDREKLNSTFPRVINSRTREPGPALIASTDYNRLPVTLKSYYPQIAILTASN
jgi:hypothetical protein